MRIKSNQIKESYDYIIIGAGIVGLTILRELLEMKKKNILVIESGGMHSGDPYPTSKNVKSKNFFIRNKSQFCGVGGGSNVWGTTNGIFDKKIVNDAYANNGFPFNYDEYINLLGETQKYGFPKVSEFETEIQSQNKLKFKKFIQVVPNIRFFHFSSMLENINVDFLQECNVEKIISENNLNEIFYNVPNNRELKSTRGLKIILCANTIENFKILKKSTLKIENDILGKGFMNHPKGIVGTVKNNKELEKFLPKDLKNRMTYIGIQLKHSDYNHYVKISKGFRVPILHYYSEYLYGIVKLHSYGISGSRLSIIKSRLLILVNYFYILLSKIMNKLYKDYYNFEVLTEIKYNEKNKMIYNQSNDTVTVDYSLSNKEIENVSKLLTEIENEFKIKFKPKSNKLIKKLISLDAAHHMGGIVIGTSSENSVVNSNLALHNNNNIFVCGGGVFPFADVVNPTMSYVALAIWLSKKII